MEIDEFKIKINCLEKFLKSDEFAFKFIGGGGFRPSFWSLFSKLRAKKLGIDPLKYEEKFFGLGDISDKKSTNKKIRFIRHLVYYYPEFLTCKVSQDMMEEILLK